MKLRDCVDRGLGWQNHRWIQDMEYWSSGLGPGSRFQNRGRIAFQICSPSIMNEIWGYVYIDNYCRSIRCVTSRYLLHKPKIMKRISQQIYILFQRKYTKKCSNLKNDATQQSILIQMIFIYIHIHMQPHVPHSPLWTFNILDIRDGLS